MLFSVNEIHDKLNVQNIVLNNHTEWEKKKTHSFAQSTIQTKNRNAFHLTEQINCKSESQAEFWCE